MRRVRNSSVNSTRLTLYLACALASAACGEGSADPLAPSLGPTGSIQITTSTTGWNLDADGYVATVEGAMGAVSASGTTTISGVPVGSRNVSLDGISPNCSVSGANPVTVQVLDGATASVAFAATCALTHLQNQVVYSLWAGADADIFAADPDGGRAVRLMTREGHDSYPRVSPDGRHVLVRGLSGGVGDIYSIAADGSGATNLTDDAVKFDEFPTWSPDGSRIAFHRRESQGQLWEIYVMNADGTGQQSLTRGAGGGWPDWSPDGSKIVFTSYRDSDNEIYVMDTDGTNATRLTNVQGSDIWARWSPDGARIAFTSMRDGNREIYVMNADGSGQVNLTLNSADDDSPVWSPDGTRLTFGSERGGGYGTWIMNADGSQPTRILDGVLVEDWAR